LDRAMQALFCVGGELDVHGASVSRIRMCDLLDEIFDGI
jgi:hypothetical protein